MFFLCVLEINAKQKSTRKNKIREKQTSLCGFRVLCLILSKCRSAEVLNCAHADRYISGSLPVSLNAKRNVAFQSWKHSYTFLW